MTKKELILLLSFVVFGVLSRTVLHIGTNIEFITAISIASGYFFKNKKLAFLTTFLTLAISDSILGNSIIFLFTWSGFFFGNILGILLSKLDLQKFKTAKLILGSEILGIISTLVFFLWTNLGVVLTTNSYEKSLSGLMQSYINAIPFLRPQLEGNLIFVPLIIIGTYLILNSSFVKSLKTHFSYGTQK